MVTLSRRKNNTTYTDNRQTGELYKAYSRFWSCMFLQLVGDINLS